MRVWLLEVGVPVWLNLTTISAAVTVAAFIAEILKAFPRYSELRRSFLLISAGFFLGSIMTATSGIHLSVRGSDSPFELLMAICAGGATVFLLAAVFAEVTAKKTEYYSIMAGMVIAFLGLLAINAIYLSDTQSSTELGYDLTLAEKLLLADRASKNKDWDRSTYMLESALSALEADDPRAQILRKRLLELKRTQVDSDLTILNGS